MTLRLHKFIILGLLLSIVAGCSGPSGESTSKYPSVRGTVRITNSKGESFEVDHAKLYLHPADGSTNSNVKIWSPVGEGIFQVVTEEGGEKTYGAPEGDYIVTIVSDPEVRKSAELRKSLVPSKYESPKTSDLKLHVEPDDVTSVEFQLTE